MKVDIFGSCVTRDAFGPDETDFVKVGNYLGRQSFIGLQDPGIFFEENWFAEVNKWEQKCLFASLRKAEDAFPFSMDAEYLIVDYIDERLDLIDIQGSRVLLTKHILQPGFTNHYQQKSKQLRRLSADTLADWTSGAETFFARAIKRYGSEKIILHKARWAHEFKDDNDNVVPFSAEWTDRIIGNNALLSRYYEITEALVPGLKTIEVEPRFIFADPAHRWSKEPFHYRQEYYTRFLELFRTELVALEGS